MPSARIVPRGVVYPRGPKMKPRPRARPAASADVHCNKTGPLSGLTAHRTEPGALSHPNRLQSFMHELLSARPPEHVAQISHVVLV